MKDIQCFLGFCPTDVINVRILSKLISVWDIYVHVCSHTHRIVIFYYVIKCLEITDPNYHIVQWGNRDYFCCNMIVHSECHIAGQIL